MLLEENRNLTCRIHQITRTIGKISIDSSRNGSQAAYSQKGSRDLMNNEDFLEMTLQTKKQNVADSKADAEADCRVGDVKALKSPITNTNTSDAQKFYQSSNLILNQSIDAQSSGFQNTERKETPEREPLCCTDNQNSQKVVIDTKLKLNL